jgi:N4-gp56 family major capsid protein
MAGQVWGTAADGGYMYSDQLSRELRITVRPTVKFRQFCDVKDGTHQGLHKGDTFNWNKYSKVATSGAKLVEGTAIAETKFTITQATMTIDEYGNSVPFTQKLDNLALHPVKEVIHKVLKIDTQETLDNAAADEFNKTAGRAIGTAADTTAFEYDGTTTQVNNDVMDASQVKNIVDEMKERNIPAYEGDDYFCLSHPSSFRALKNDLESIHQYVESGFTMIRNGEIGRFEGVRFIEQTQRAKGGGAAGMGDGGTGAWSNGLSSWALFFGSDTVAEAVAVPEEIRGKIPTDYGRSRGIAWYYLGGFGIVHPDDGGANNTDCRCILWDSAT